MPVYLHAFKGNQARWGKIITANYTCQDFNLFTRDAYRETRWNHGGDHFSRELPLRITPRIPWAPSNGSSSKTDLPSSNAACASEPTVPARLCFSANSRALRLNRGYMQR